MDTTTITIMGTITITHTTNRQLIDADRVTTVLPGYQLLRATFCVLPPYTWIHDESSSYHSRRYGIAR